jgi:lysozyme
MRGRTAVLLILGGAGGSGVVVSLFLSGLVRFNYPSAARYPVRGVDVSQHQGRIDWVKLRDQGYAFAFIKATEGADHHDPFFAANWSTARREGIACGAYHFFTFCTAGEQQAANFISTVAPGQEMLPPAVDIEFIGNCARPPSAVEIRAELATFLNRIESAYARKPILYVTSDSYERIVSGAFPDHPIWVRNIFCEPKLADHTGWTFWQYADRGRIDGIATLVDLNVFHGAKETFLACATLGHCR